MIVRESISTKFQVVEKVFLDEFDLEKIRNVENSLSDAKLQRIEKLEQKGLNQWTQFSWFEDAEVIRVILIHVYDDNIMLDKPYLITKEIISIIIGLCNNGTVLANKSITNEEV